MAAAGAVVAAAAGLVGEAAGLAGVGVALPPPPHPAARATIAPMTNPDETQCTALNLAPVNILTTSLLATIIFLLAQSYLYIYVFPALTDL